MPMRSLSRATPSSVIDGPSGTRASCRTRFRRCCIQHTMRLSELLVSHPCADDEPLLHTIDRSVTAGAARQAATSTAAALRDAGVGPGQPVAVQFPNTPEMVTTMFGVWMADAVFVPVNWRAPAAEVERAVGAVEAVALVRPDGLRRLQSPRECDPPAPVVQWASRATRAPQGVPHTHTPCP